jgi:hypothetical protein
VAAKGGAVADIVIGDCLELLRVADDQNFGPAASSPYFYQLLRAAGVFAGTGPTVGGLRTQGHLDCEQLIDRYSIACRPVRDLLVDYLRERQPGLDYASLHKRSYTLGRLFWRDWKTSTPGSPPCTCPPTSRRPGNSAWPARASAPRSTGRSSRRPRHGSTPRNI